MVSHHLNSGDLDSRSLREVTPEPSQEAGPANPPPMVPRHTVLKYLRATQKYSAFGIMAFAGLHLTSSLILPPISMSWANSAFMVSRSVYQTELGELFLVYGSVGIHLLSGTILHIYRMINHYRDHGETGYKLYATRGAISGWALAVFTGAHAAIMRWGPPVKLGDSSMVSLDYVTYGLQSKPWILSLLLLGLSGSALSHISMGVKRYFHLKISRWAEKGIVGSGLVWTALTLAVLSRQEKVRGWIAEQFALAYSFVL